MTPQGLDNKDGKLRLPLEDFQMVLSDPERAQDQNQLDSFKN